jgi:hypothetical protein
MSEITTSDFKTNVRPIYNNMSEITTSNFKTNIVPVYNNSLVTEPKTKFNILDGITILNFAFIIIIQIFPALICTKIFNYIFYDRTDEEYIKISTFQLFIEIWLHFWFILILYYIFRNIFIQIPSPFNNLYNSGFQNKYANETQSAYIFTIVFILCQPSLRSKIIVFKDRIFMYT